MYPELYKKGIAVGQSNIKADTLVFRFRNEVFEFPTIDAIHLASHNGYFYEAKVADLRALKKELKDGIV